MYHLVQIHHRKQEPATEFETSVDINAPVDQVWATLIDVERWPEFTPSVTSVKRLDDGPMAVGAKARVKQPGFPELVWEVTGFDPRTSFTWKASSPGVRTSGTHRLTAGARGVRVTLGIDQTGALAGIVSLFSGDRTRHHVQIEADALKRRCEAASPVATGLRRR